MKSNETEMKVQELISQGMQENVDFRVVYFSDCTEIKMTR